MLKNLTPHAVHVVNADGIRVLEIPVSGVIARLVAKTETVGEFCGVPLTKTVFGQPENLPDPEEGTLFIVSQIIKSALPERSDLVVPAEVARDAAGNIVGCKSLGL